jgi:DNA polymerase III alpha subunit (gram-positive type)
MSRRKHEAPSKDEDLDDHAFESNHHEDEHEEHEEHIDERWLVSYADMMTLLFGLFVMLYSMAMEHKGNLDQKLKEMADQTFAQSETRPQPVNGAPLEKIPNKQEIDALKMKVAKLELKEHEIIDLKETLMVTQKELDQKTESLQQQEQSLQQSRQIASVQNSAQDSVQTQKKVIERQLDESKRKLEEQEKQMQSLRKEVEIEKEKQKVMQKENQKVVKAQPTPRPTPPPEKVETEKLVKELKEMQKEVQAKDLQLQKAEEKIKDLEKDKRSEGGSFLMFVVRWTTDKHDIDMTVIDPAGRKYDFKKRKYPGQPGEFTLDSRQGPGAEIWQADKFIPGVYTVTATLYQDYGNEKPAAVEASIVSSMRRMQLKPASLKAGEKTSWKVNVGEKGDVTIVP